MIEVDLGLEEKAVAQQPAIGGQFGERPIN
jgi:hypothetical protein